MLNIPRSEELTIFRSDKYILEHSPMLPISNIVQPAYLPNCLECCQCAEYPPPKRIEKMSFPTTCFFYCQQVQGKYIQFRHLRYCSLIYDKWYGSRILFKKFNEFVTSTSFDPVNYLNVLFCTLSKPLTKLELNLFQAITVKFTM